LGQHRERVSQRSARLAQRLRRRTIVRVNDREGGTLSIDDEHLLVLRYRFAHAPGHAQLLCFDGGGH
jgi:hypothetical protein